MTLKDVLPLLKTFNCVSIIVYGEAVKVNGVYQDTVLATAELDSNEKELLAKYGDLEATDIHATDTECVTVLCI